MEIQFQYTFEEYREAAAAMTASQQAQQKRSQGNWRRKLVWVAVIGVLYFAVPSLWVYFGGGDGLDPYIHLAIPIFSLCFLGAVITLYSIWHRRGPKRAWQLVQGIGALAVMLGFLFLVFLFKYFSQNPASRHAGAIGLLLLPHTGWILLLAIFCYMFIRIQRARIRKQWDGQPYFQRGKIVEITAAGVTVADALTRQEFHWEAFVRTEETKNLFVLATSTITCLFLPKRAFTSEEMLEAMRMLMHAATIRTGGFAVLPASPPPLSVVPPRPDAIN
jgi:hypothetical protein